MAELFIREGDLETVSRAISEVAAELGNRSLSDIPTAEERAMRGIAESGLPGLANDITEFLTTLAARIDEASGDCLAAAADFTNVDESFERAFEVTIETEP